MIPFADDKYYCVCQLIVARLQMSSEIKVCDYIEQKYKQFEKQFVDFEWVKLYLEEIVQRELHLIDLFFSSSFSSEISKWRCAIIMNKIFCALVDQLDSKLLCEILIESNTTDDKLLIDSSLNSFLIQDLLNVVIDYSLSTRVEVGMYIDVLDASGEWDIGEIKQILQYKNNVYLFIRYLECTDWYDECVLAKSKRIKLLYDNKGQIVYKWAKVDPEHEEVDCRWRGQCNWKRSCNRSERDWVHPSRTNFAPAGTFLK